MSTLLRPRPRPRIVPAGARGAPVAPTPLPAFDPPHPARRDYATQIISPHLVARLWQIITWTGLALSFSVSVLGNVRPFGGDVTRLATTTGTLNTAYLVSAPFGWALLGAAIYQIVVQIAQFRFADRWRVYLALIVASVVPSLWTFAPLLLAVNDTRRIGFVWLFGAAAVVLGLNDFMQEQALQKRR